MPKYLVSFVDTQDFEVEVEAPSYQEAINIVGQLDEENATLLVATRDVLSANEIIEED